MNSFKYVVLIIALSMTPLCFSEQFLMPISSVGFGVERQALLTSDARFDGIVIDGEHSFLDDFLVAAELGFFQENVGKSDFTLQQQQLLVGYRFNTTSNIETRFLVGIVREDLKHEGVNFENSEDDSSIILKVFGSYDFNATNQLNATISYRQIYEIDRYGFKFEYGLQLTHHWWTLSSFELGYGDKFDHDINEYRLQVKYQF